MSNTVFPLNPPAPNQTMTIVPVAAPQASATASDFDPMQLAWKYRIWLVCGVVIGLFAGHLIYQQLGAEYVATGKVLVSKRGHIKVREGEESGSGGRGQHVALIMSPLIVGRAVELHHLDRLPTMARSKDVVEDIVSDLKVQRSAGDENTVLNVLDITYKSASRSDGKKVIEAIIAAYDEFLKESHQESMAELVNLVDKANVTLRGQINSVETAYEKFRSSAPIHLKQPLRGPNGERITVAANVHQDNLLALDKERQTLLLRKAELQSQIQSFEGALASGRSREELAASIHLLVPGSYRNDDSRASILSPSLNLDRPHAESSDSQWLVLKLQEEKLVLDYGDDWPELQTIRKQLALIEKHYRAKGLKLPLEAPPPPVATPGIPAQQQADRVDLVSAYTFSLRQQYDALMRREKEINRVYAEEYEQAKNLSRFVEQDRRMNEDLDRLNGMWGDVRKQAAQIDLLKDNHTYTLKPISPVRDQLSIKRMIKLYGAGLGGVLGAICVMIVAAERSQKLITGLSSTRREELTQTFETALRKPVEVVTPIIVNRTAAVADQPNEVAVAPAALPVSTQPTEPIVAPVVAPVLEPKPVRAKPRRSVAHPPFASLCEVPEFGLLPMAGQNGEFISELRVLNEPESASANSIRALAESLIEQAHGLKQTIAVVSPEVGDGKTTLAANLAVALAQLNKRVLAIDGDVFAPSLHTQFGLRDDLGLLEVATREVDVLTASRPTMVPGLYVLTSGNPKLSAEEVAAWDLRPILDEARREFDFVLFDTPSMMSSTFGSSLAQIASGSVFVWRPDQSAPETIRRASEILVSNGSRVLGAVANRCVEVSENAMVGS